MQIHTNIANLDRKIDKVAVDTGLLIDRMVVTVEAELQDIRQAK